MQQIRELRKGQGMRLAQVAEKTGLSVSYLSDLERGRTDPSLKTLRLLAACFDVTVAHLLDEEKAMPKQETDVQIATIQGVGFGMRDIPDGPGLWFSVEWEGYLGALQAFSWEESKQIITDANVYDIKELNGKRCIIEIRGSIVRYVGLVKL